MTIRSVARIMFACIALSFTASALAQNTQLVLVHGLRSNGATWNDAASRLRGELAVDTHQPDLTWYHTYEDQASELHSQLGGLPTPTVAIGHSNGGLVARVWSHSHPLDGLVTIGTPHRGAPLVPNAPDYAYYAYLVGSTTSSLVSEFFDCWFCESYSYDGYDLGQGAWNWIWDQVGGFVWTGSDLNALSFAIVLADMGLDIGAPVTGEMWPGSFLSHRSQFEWQHRIRGEHDPQPRGHHIVSI